jgi:hypothetical protein
MCRQRSIDMQILLEVRNFRALNNSQSLNEEERNICQFDSIFSHGLMIYFVPILLRILNLLGDNQ